MPLCLHVQIVILSVSFISYILHTFFLLCAAFYSHLFFILLSRPFFSLFPPPSTPLLVDTPGYGSVIDARTNFALFMNHVSQTFEEKNSRISPFIEVTNNELMRSLVTGTELSKDKNRQNTTHSRQSDIFCSNWLMGGALVVFLFFFCCYFIPAIHQVVCFGAVTNKKKKAERTKRYFWHTLTPFFFLLK